MNLNSRFGRLSALLDVYLRDHGFLRAVYNNLHHLGGGMYRCGQPNPAHLRRYHRTLGIRTVINLRGENTTGGYRLEEAVCRDLGVTLLNCNLMSSRKPPTVDEVHGMRKLFADIEYPAVMHCKSGADRAGLASALYRILHRGEHPSDAAGELAWYYGHFGRAGTGVLDEFLAEYLRWDAQRPTAFMAWVEEIYDREALRERFRGGRWSTWTVDRLLRRE